MGCEYAVGLDVGGTKSVVALGRAGLGGDITVIDQFAFPTEASREPEYAVQRLINLSKEILAKHSVSVAQLLGVGVSCGGPLDTARGVILSPPNLPRWEHVPIVDILQREFSVPVRLENDANAGALAEWRFGAGRGTRNMIYCTFGTGFGAGLIIDGRLFTGANGMAGEIGHVRLAPDGPVGYGKQGSVEGFCSGAGLAQMSRQYVLEHWQRGGVVQFCSGPTDLAGLNAQIVAAAARAGDELAREIYREAGRRLGMALAILIDLLNPEMVVIGSIFSRQRELLWPEAARVIAEEALERSAEVCRVVPAALGEQTGVFASLAVVLYDRLVARQGSDGNASEMIPRKEPSLDSDASRITTYSVRSRRNLVTIENMAQPGITAIPEWDHPEFADLVERIVTARRNGRQVIWFQGAHVLKCGLSRYVIDLVKRGFVTHVAGNGATSIHDFELAFLGGTSEDVPTAIENGSFGMWEETGRWMNEAIRNGYAQGLGYGESLAFYIREHPERFPYADDCILAQAFQVGVPATYHVTIGTDIIHQHPEADFAAIGGASGRDFLRFSQAVTQLEGGVFLNFGSAVTGAEVFLKGLSIARNLGYKVENLTTANFDIVPLGDYKAKVDADNPHYYYRPRKNIVNRPTSLGGRGFHLEGFHQQTIPNLWARVTSLLPEVEHGVRG